VPSLISHAAVAVAAGVAFAHKDVPSQFRAFAATYRQFPPLSFGKRGIRACGSRQINPLMIPFVRIPHIYRIHRRTGCNGVDRKGDTPS